MNQEEGDPDETGAGVLGNHAFISYQSQSSRRYARQLQRELERIAKRGNRGDSIRIFRDETNLTFADLGDTLRSELLRSRRLLLVLHRDTSASKWVNEEVEFWLANGGSRDRLILVRADPELDLTWDEGKGAFAHEESLPAAVQGLFSSEPLWVDLDLGPFGRPRSDDGQLARLCATILERDPDEILQRELAEQKQRQRRLTAVLAGVTILSILAVAASILAVVKGNEATRQRNEAQAQANAAETLLQSTTRPDKAIEGAIRASRQSSNGTVRSALLSVINDSPALVKLIPMSDLLKGNAPKDVALNSSGTRLLGTYGPEWESGMVLWDTTTGKELGGGPLPDSVSGTSVGSPLQEPVFLSDNSVAFCTDSGAFAATFLGGTDVRVDELAAGTDCLQWPMREGSMFVVEGASNQGEALVVDRDAKTTTIGQVTFAGMWPSSDLGLIRRDDRTYAAVRADGRVTDLNALTSLAPMRITDVDQWGRVSCRAANGRWMVASIADDAADIVLPAPADAIAAAVVPTATPGAIWVTPGGMLQWSLGSQKLQLSRPVSPTSMPTVWVDATASRAVVVIPDDQSAIVVDLPPQWDTKGVMAEKQVIRGLEGDRLEIEGSVRSSAYALALPTGTGSTLITSDGVEEYPDPIHLDPSSQQGISFGADGLTYVPLSKADPVRLDEGGGAQAAAFNDGGTLIAVARPAGPVALYRVARLKGASPLVAEADSANRLVTAMGTVIFSLDRGAVLRSTVSDGKTKSVFTAAPGDVLSLVQASPSGRQVVIEVKTPGAEVTDEHREKRLVVSADGESKELNSTCDDVQLEFVAAPGFQSDVEAAEQERLVRVVPSNTSPHSMADCLDGSDAGTYEDVKTLDRQISASAGRFATFLPDTGETRVSTWTPGRADSMKTATLSNDGQLSHAIDSTNSVAAVWFADSPSLVIRRLVGERWEADLNVTVPVDTIAGAAVLSDENLVVTAGANGEVVLLDLLSGRLVLKHTVSPVQEQNETVTSLAATVTDGRLRVDLTAANADSSGGDPSLHSIELPLDIDQLRARLCAISPTTPECAPSG